VFATAGPHRIRARGWVTGGRTGGGGYGSKHKRLRIIDPLKHPTKEKTRKATPTS